MPITATRSITTGVFGVSTSGSAGTVNTASSWIPTDIHLTPFNVGFGVTINGEGIVYRVQHTFDNVFDPDVTAKGIQIFNHPDFTAASVSKDGNYAYGVRAIRLLAVSASGSAAAELDLIQVG